MPSKKKLKRKLAEARNDAAYWQEKYEYMKYMTGWCDYTGWDCQSGNNWEKVT